MILRTNSCMSKKITMNIDETLELDFLVEQVSDDSIDITGRPNNDSSSVEYISRRSGVFNPENTGIYNFDVNGQSVEIEVTETPTSGIYLDDFTDERLSGRDSYSETQLSPIDLEPSTSSFSSPVRPEWTVDSGSFSFTNGVLEVGQGDKMFTPLDQSKILNNDTTWEFAVEYTGTDNSGSSTAWVGLIANNSFSGPWNNPSSGFWVQINDNITSGGKSDGFSLMNSYDNQRINDTSFSDAFQLVYVKVTRSSSGEWELFTTTSLPFESSDSAGTYTEGSEPNFGYHSVGTRNEFSPSMNLEYTLIY